MTPLISSLASACHAYGVGVVGEAPRTAVVIMTFANGQRHRLELSEAELRNADKGVGKVFPPSIGTELPDKATSFDAAVLRVMETLRPDALIGAEELADRAGHSLNGHTRERLAAMVRDGLIAGHGRRGYGPMPKD